ncbi:hypothetical protein PCK1_000471 [Pneumocystis canis]|nr:hypothetical protein PCK1_000471 [Pneumocystis canis]
MTQKYSSKDRKRSTSRGRNCSLSPHYNDRHDRSKYKSRRHERRSRERHSRRRSKESDVLSRSNRDSYTNNHNGSSFNENRRSASPLQTYRRNEYSPDPRESQSSSKFDTEASKDSWIDDIDRQTLQMNAMLGFSGFKTTHQKKVEGNDISAVYKVKPTKYRQYMNRRGGFNRPLDTDTPRR